jgi:hypothetical protein
MVHGSSLWWHREQEEDEGLLTPGDTRRRRGTVGWDMGKGSGSRTNSMIRVLGAWR